MLGSKYALHSTRISKMLLLHLTWHQSIRADIFPLSVEKKPLLAGICLLMITISIILAISAIVNDFSIKKTTLSF